jgi:hypothetical protein
MTITIVKNSISQEVQRHPRVWVTAAPKSGPNAGPKNGVATYNDIGPERFSGGHMSLNVPEPMLRLGAAKKPAKNRNTIKVAMLCANPVPSIKSAKIGRLMKMTGRLPNVSLSGAAKGPPNARPSWYMENASVAISLVELSSEAAGSMPGVKTDEANVPTKATPEMVYVWNHFRAGDQLCGFRGSSASSQSSDFGRSWDDASCAALFDGPDGVAFSGSVVVSCSELFVCGGVLLGGVPFSESAKLAGRVPAAVVADQRLFRGALCSAIACISKRKSADYRQQSHSHSLHHF